ncbi:RnfABCDGE type electron transport complex subunit B [Sporosalibacterium faouarense]|uniref:RnfABCDGE type electron transport complex subunit B n=1 Tax=Sporosalibacterium faouarense TaxID=516123 RepID=UPI001FAF40D9|nr:RnfABCDGE type electron transport complex subunit B [Sporosalibacterium faouarense]
MNVVIISVVSMGTMGALFAIGLAYASKKFAVEVDPRIEEISSVLPGANCGACGYPGCDNFASAVAKGDAPSNGCPVGGAEVAEKVADIMGIDTDTDDEIKIARVICQGKTCHTSVKYQYDGIKDCRAAAKLGSGNKSCDYGCLGFGTCVDICSFDAIEIIDGIAKINPDKCTACGKCIDVCPKSVIDLVPYSQRVIVDCNSKDFGKKVKSSCVVGCIGCKLCERSCPFDAIHVEDNIATIDYEKCTNCGICADKCPTNSIWEDKSKKKKA